MLNIIWGVVPPKKNLWKKNGKCNQDDFYKCYQNPLRQLLKQFSELYQLWGPVTWPLLEGWCTRNSWFSRFLEFSEFLIFLHEIFFGSKILPCSCDKHQHFNLGALGREAQSPDFGHFLTIWGIFRAVCLGTSL